MKKLLIFGGIIIAVFVLIFVLNSQKNKDALANNPYDTKDLRQSTIDLIDDPNYQNIILPEDLEKRLLLENLLQLISSAQNVFIVKK